MRIVRFSSEISAIGFCWLVCHYCASVVTVVVLEFSEVINAIGSHESCFDGLI
jgi:hypothetical protein